MITDGLNPLTVLLFVGAVLAAFVLAGTYVFARVTKRERVARISSRVFVGGAAIYVALILIGSLTSHSRALAPGAEKHICEIDCHLAYSVAAARAESVGGGLVRHVVTVKVRFDDETISSRPTDASSRWWTVRGTSISDPRTRCGVHWYQASRTQPTSRSRYP
jgi:hypothetical protein